MIVKMENEDVSFVAFLASLDMDEVVHDFLDQIGLDDIALDYPYPFDLQLYRKLEFYYVY